MKPITSLAVALLLFTATTAVSLHISEPQDLKTSASKPSESVSQQLIASTKTADTNAPAPDPSLTNTYRIGVGDVLDIRLLNARVPHSTLYSVVEGGLIDYPIAGGPILVAGLTAEEVQTLIAAELKRRAFEESALVSVGVRQYASHSVNITGFVGSPGTKFLRREAVPLYVILAESQARQDAGRVAIIRAGGEVLLDLGEPATLNFLIKPGDLISVSGRPQLFYYIGGRVNYPGQKNFQAGITLVQALLASGGPSRKGDNVIELSREDQAAPPTPDEQEGRVSREKHPGKLVTVQFRLKEIKAGRIPDPQLQPGDRIDVVR
jgi:protein involved in polysaccharide export with SLBB domain